MTSRSKRLSIKEENVLATREALTKRRQEYTNKIRKQRKNMQLALKRRYVPLVGSTYTTTHTDPTGLVELCNAVLQNPTLPHLTALQSALSSGSKEKGAALQPSDGAEARSLKPQELEDAVKFVNVLGGVLMDPSSDLQLISARILTNLAAMEPEGTNDDIQVSYYGNIPDGWSTIIAKSNVLPIFHRIMSSPAREPELIPQCCWALGNLVADSQVARDAAMPLLPILASIISQGQESNPWLCRNAAWALSNLARGNSGQAFCGPSLLTSALLAQLLTSPERMKMTSSSQVPWWDVAHEAAWIVAFLTAQEDEAVDYLCLSSTSPSFSAQASNPILEALGCRLHHAVQVLRRTDALSSSDASQALRMSIPCIRAIGNIASACQGKHLPSILKAHDKSIVQSIATLLELGSFPSSHAVAVEAAWAARTLLCDAGLPNHESTEIAIPILIPPLCNCVTSGHSKSELKREAISALWTATAAPPHSDQSMGSVWATRTTRDEFLQQIATTDKMLPQLVDLLRHSMDMDLVMSTLQLLNAILRRGDDNLRVQFEQHDGVNALEHICDTASAQSHYGSGSDWEMGDIPAAEIASDLIDDLFESHENGDEVEMHDVAPVSNGATFSFGMPPPVKMSVVPAETMQPVGRGRGRPVPAWMSQG